MISSLNMNNRNVFYLRFGGLGGRLERTKNKSSRPNCRLLLKTTLYSSMRYMIHELPKWSDRPYTNYISLLSLISNLIILCTRFKQNIRDLNICSAHLLKGRMKNYSIWYYTIVDVGAPLNISTGSISHS